MAGGGVTCIVEMKTKNTEILRSYLYKKKVPFEGYQIISCGAGEINAKPEEILFIDDAIKIFKNFFNNYKMSNEVKWK
ncbi:hypothetical protein [Thalassospira alkalitolerans]|uniref:hypothetical protein n=1 Tax=Thalassospira alkalitolerans TaxID=1293890 RepID=UPI003AA8422D